MGTPPGVLRFTGVGQCHGAQEQREARRRADSQRLLESFKRRDAVMFGHRYDKSAKGQRRRIVAAIGQSRARMSDSGVVVFFVEPAESKKDIVAGGGETVGCGVIGLDR
jgi:hypothetical protein